jgi:cytochrome c biogenesis protein CcdA
MTGVLFSGALAAAFAAGAVAFFAPCCSGVMVPSYLAAVSGGSRGRLMRLSGLYALGLAAVVWPITLGAAWVSSLVTRWHPALFIAGGVMMILVGLMLIRGTMVPLSVPQPALSGSRLSVLGLGAFSGAATACCAPALAGAIALSAISGSLWGGALLGAAYIAGMLVPLVPVALLVQGARGRVRDRIITLRALGRVVRVGVVRLTGALVFIGFGALFIALAVTGNADTAPGFQVTIGAWVRTASVHLGAVPNVVSLPVLIVLATAMAVLLHRERSRKELS